MPFYILTYRPGTWHSRGRAGLVLADNEGAIYNLFKGCSFEPSRAYVFRKMARLCIKAPRKRIRVWHLDGGEKDDCRLLVPLCDSSTLT